jgi:DNA helicase HerA-like ATPase
VILEEAHRLLSRDAAAGKGGKDTIGPDARGQGAALFVDILAEIRAYGQGIVIVEQIPTKIVPDAVKNSNLKIMCRLTSKEDRDFLGEAMDLNEEQKRFVGSLKPVQFIAFEEKLDQPLLLTLPLPIESPAVLRAGKTQADYELFAGLFPAV